MNSTASRSANRFPTVVLPAPETPITTTATRREPDEGAAVGSEELAMSPLLEADSAPYSAGFAGSMTRA